MREPAPIVDATPVPSLTNPGSEVVFRAEQGGFEAVYFGYTNCPDVCPTTMADWAITLRRLPEELAAQVGTVMVTVDPDRDNDILPGYVESFVADAQAAGHHRRRRARRCRGSVRGELRGRPPTPTVRSRCRTAGSCISSTTRVGWS